MAESLPLHELISRISAPTAPGSVPLWPLGTMQALNRRLVDRPFLNFFNATLRGVGQALFVNNPVSGLLLLVAMFLQSPWMGVMSLVGVIAATLTAKWMRLPAAPFQNGIFGFNGLLIGAALGFFGARGNGPWNPVWIAAVVVLSALSVAWMQTIGSWLTVRLKATPVGIAFNSFLLAFFLLVKLVPQSFWNFGPPPAPFPAGSIEGLPLVGSLPTAVAQVFFCDGIVPLLLILLAIGICTPIAVPMVLLGGAMHLLAGLLLGAKPGELYLGLGGQNAVLTILAIGGIFYTPNRRSITIAAFAAFLASILTILMAGWLAPLHIPVFVMPFMVVTIGCFLVLRRTLPSLVPIAIQAVASPEEHRRRYDAAWDVITQFRSCLVSTAKQKRGARLFDQASPAVKEDLRRVFDAIDNDRNGELCVEEVKAHLSPAGISPEELTYLFACIDVDNNGRLSFQEIGEMLLRHRRLMSRYEEFITYLLPIDADEDDVISVGEMNIAMASVGEPPLTKQETELLQRQTGGRPLTWSRFIEVLLLS